jgi:hypothetical protein
VRSTIGLAGLAFALIVPSAALRAETTKCTEIMSTPYTIPSPGIYCLNDSLTGTISIEASDVVLDLNGHVLQSSSPGVGFAVRAQDRANITIRNGTIRGYNMGIYLGGMRGSRSHLIERLRITDNSGSAIAVWGDGSVVRHNTLLNNGYEAGSGARFILYAGGNGIHVADNQVIDSGVGAINEVVGIRTDGSGVAVERNVVSNAEIGPHNSRGILVNGGGTARNSVVGNRIVNMKIGIMNGFGTAGPAVFMDNTVGGASTPFFFGVLAGSTNTSY